MYAPASTVKLRFCATRETGWGKKRLASWGFCHVNQKGTKHLLGALLSDSRTHARPPPVSGISRGGHPYVIWS